MGKNEGWLMVHNGYTLLVKGQLISSKGLGIISCLGIIGVPIAKFFIWMGKLKKNRHWREVVFWDFIVVLVSMMIWFYYTALSMPHLERIGYIGSFMAGIGLFILGVQYLDQTKAMEISNENEKFIRMWNINSLVDDILEKFSLYKNNRMIIVNYDSEGEQLEFETTVYEITKLKITNLSLLKGLNNKVHSLTRMIGEQYVDPEMLNESYNVFCELFLEFEENGMGKPLFNSFLKIIKEFSEKK